MRNKSRVFVATTEKVYCIHEMSEILHSNGKQAIERKLKGYDIEFITSGRGDDVVFEITAIQNKFSKNEKEMVISP